MLLQCRYCNNVVPNSGRESLTRFFSKIQNLYHGVTKSMSFKAKYCKKIKKPLIIQNKNASKVLYAVMTEEKKSVMLKRALCSPVPKIRDQRDKCQVTTFS